MNFKFNVSNTFILFSKSAGAEQHVNNLHISCNCCGQWGVGGRTTLVFCQPHTTEGHSELMVVALLLQLHFPEEFGLKTGSGSPLWKQGHQRQGFIGVTFLHLPFAHQRPPVLIWLLSPNSWNTCQLTRS